MSEFSPLKAAWHIEKIAELRRGNDIVPTHVQIVLSDLCNQDCHFCAYRMEGGFATEKFADASGNKNPNRRIPTAKALEIVEDCAALGVQAIEFTGGGEPTVHPDCMQIIGRAQALGMKTGLVTNGVRLSPHPAVEALTWIRVSLDAATAETYQRIRKSSAWPQAMRALAYLSSIPGPYVGVGFVVTRENFRELVHAARLVRALGIPYMRVSAMFSDAGAGYYDGIEGEVAAQRAVAKFLETDTFKVVDYFDDRINDLKRAAPNYQFCGSQQFVLYIGGDQKVYTCCTNAYTTRGEIGDLAGQRFSEWIKTHRRFDFDARGCHHCQFHTRNAAINYLIDKSPPHVEFV